MDEAAERAKVVAVARSFVGTPYADCGKVKGHGVDCATLLAMVFEEAGIEPPIEIPNYSPQWFLHRGDELYLGRVLDRAKEITEEQSRPGDVVLYKFGRCFAHGGIIIDPGFPTIIHAYKPARMVIVGEGIAGMLADRDRRFFTRKVWGA